MSSSRLSPERMNLSPYGRTDVGGSGTIALVNGNVPWVWVEEDKDLWKLETGQCLMTGQTMMGGARVTIHNPFSYPAKIQVARGMPPALVSNSSGIPSFSNPGRNAMEGVFVRGGSDSVATVAGKKKGVLFSAKRSSFWVQLYGITNADGWEVITWRGMTAANFLARSAGIVDTAPITFCRLDGTTNAQLLAAAGTFTDTADLVAWETAQGYAGTRQRWPFYGASMDFLVDPQTVVLVSGPNAGTIRPTVAASEMGDMLMEFRGEL